MERDDSAILVTDCRQTALRLVLVGNEGIKLILELDPMKIIRFHSVLAAKTARGFTLVEIAVVLAVVALVLGFLIPTTGTLIDNQNRASTVLKLRNIEVALQNFTLVNRRLPCPADGTAATGVEGDCTGSPQQANGVVPWAAIGLTLSDILDSWNNRITYRVGYGLTRPNALDMSFCDPAGTADANPTWAGAAVNTGACLTTCSSPFSAATCTSPQNFLSGKGLNVSNGAQLVMDQLKFNAAAYVLISHGRNGYGAMNMNGTYMAAAGYGLAGTTLEGPNISTVSVTSAIPPTGFVDATLSESGDATTYFDDLVLHPTLISVIERAHLGPRLH